MKLLEFLDEHICPPPLASESCSLPDACGRVVAGPVESLRDLPSYDESARDGFALSGNTPCWNLVDHEAYAGNTAQIELCDGDACAIMTGGIVPSGCTRILPKEYAQVVDKKITSLAPHGLPSFIRQLGSSVKKGIRLVDAGTIICSEHIALFANTGNTVLPVTQKPKVAIFATGSELQDVSEPCPVVGRKTASNGLVLSCLVEEFGGTPYYIGLVEDDKKILTNCIKNLANEDHQVIIATGGMGPGRYDFMEECFKDAGGEIIVNSVPLMPGKSCLIGLLNGKLFYGLPGTPSASRPLFIEIISRSLLALQGVGETSPHSFQARLAEDIFSRMATVTSLYSARISFSKGQIMAQGIRGGGVVHGYIVVPPNTNKLMAGSTVWVHSASSPFVLKY